VRRGGNPEAGQSLSEPPAGRGWLSRTGPAGSVVVLTGDWIARDGAGAEYLAVARIVGAAHGPQISLDTSELGRWDTALLVFISALREAARQHGFIFDEAGLPAPARRLLALPASAAANPVPEPQRLSLVARVGRSVIAGATEALAVVTIVGETILRAGALPFGRVRMRGTDLLTCAYDAGIAALPVVTVINILVGCILAFVGAVQLRRYGGDIYVAALVGIAMIREMAALMTAIVMSGRTGGAYAAQIATMQGSEEIDALRVIGIPVNDYLILPRIIALTLMMPLLYLYGSALGIFGGFVVSIAMLNLSAVTFIQQTRDSIVLSQLLFGLTKSIAFGALIAITSCRTGLRAGRSAADVGHAATTAVVVSIVGVIALDAIFAVCANTLDF
jgi:phospholipid/cholesterol/gamma-HCH transport system permease protein